MILKLTPQRTDIAVSYSALSSELIVTVNGKSDSFDFSGMNEGDLATDFKTSLDYNPLISATVENGVIIVKAIHSYVEIADASEKENREVTL